MPLDGVNKKCSQCIKACKQWKQVKVLVCPNFRSAQTKNPIPCKHNKTPKPPLSAMQMADKGKDTTFALQSQEGA